MVCWDVTMAILKNIGGNCWSEMTKEVSPWSLGSFMELWHWDNFRELYLRAIVWSLLWIRVILQVPWNHHFLSLVLMLLACCCSIRSYIHQGELCYGVLAVLKQRRSLSVKMWKLWHKLGTAFFSHEISSALGLPKNPGKRWSCTNKHQHPPPLAAVNYLSSHHPVLLSPSEAKSSCDFKSFHIMIFVPLRECPLWSHFGRFLEVGFI